MNTVVKITPETTAMLADIAVSCHRATRNPPAAESTPKSTVSQIIGINRLLSR